jgi:hypothetical protein
MALVSAYRRSTSTSSDKTNFVVAADGCAALEVYPRSVVMFGEALHE